MLKHLDFFILFFLFLPLREISPYHKQYHHQHKNITYIRQQFSDNAIDRRGLI